MSKVFILKSEEYDILKQSGLNDSKIFNLSEIELCISCNSDYKIHLYSVDSLDYIKIDNINSFYTYLNKYCTENLNYTLNEFVNHEEKIIEIYITPIVTSA